MAHAFCLRGKWGNQQDSGRLLFEEDFPIPGREFSCVQLCVTPIDGSLPGSRVPGILQTGTLEWVAISFSNAWKWKVKVKSLSRVQLLATPWTAAHQAPPSMGFSRQEYWSGVPLPSLWACLLPINWRIRQLSPSEGYYGRAAGKLWVGKCPSLLSPPDLGRAYGHFFPCLLCRIHFCFSYLLAHSFSSSDHPVPGTSFLSGAELRSVGGEEGGGVSDDVTLRHSDTDTKKSWPVPGFS